SPHWPGVTTYDDADLDELYRRLYLQLKDGTVDPEVAFDLACHVLSVYPFAEDATELARLCLEDDSESGIAAAARDFLSGYRPGFAEEPGWLATLEEALEVVNRDMRACGLPGTGHLHIWDSGTHWEYALFIRSAPTPPNATARPSGGAVARAVT
ncbi:MAG TPA: hypothetical protein VI365_14530, partial [Trebonia sp.]